MISSKADIATSALIVVDVQNDFVSEGGYFDRMAKKHPESGVDREFLASAIPNIRRLVEAFRAALLADAAGPRTGRIAIHRAGDVGRGDR
jgi:predicted dinucleotide-binding enzyme